jgi:hypothetical protein
VVEVEGHARQQRAGYEEARLKGAAWNLENPVPLLWVAAGNHDALYQLQPSQSSIQYAPLEGETPDKLLAPARLLEAIGDYLRRTETEAGQELRYRDALQRALAESRGNSAHEKFRNSDCRPRCVKRSRWCAKPVSQGSRTLRWRSPCDTRRAATSAH